MISLEERYQNFKKTIQECGSYLLTESDDTIKHNLFEEFSIDVISFLHEDTLNLFLDEGMIDDDILEKSIVLGFNCLRSTGNERLIRECHIKMLEIDCVGLDGFFVQTLVVFAVV